MTRFLILGLIVVALIIPAFSTPTWAATSVPAAAMQDDGSAVSPRRQLATIIFSGLAGAVLGLSTLSFYGRPQEKLSNIAIGFAAGIITGTAYTTYQAATRPYTAFGLTSDDSVALASKKGKTLGLSWQMSF